MNFERLEERLKNDEGFSATPYQDSLGVWTIGYGCTRFDGNRVTEGTPQISKNYALSLLRHHMVTAIILCQKLYKNFNDLDPVRQEILVNMGYNLGNKLKAFKRMNAAVEKYDYVTWAEEMRDSVWWKQVRSRAVRLRNAVLTGEWL